MVLTIDLPPDVAAKVSRLAKERGVDDAAYVAEVTTEKVLSERVDLPEPKIVTNPITGTKMISLGYPITREDVKRFLEEEE